MKRLFALCVTVLLFVSSACPALARGSSSWDFEGYPFGEYPLQVSSIVPVAAEIKAGANGKKALCVTLQESGTCSVTVPFALDAAAAGEDSFYVLFDFSGWGDMVPEKDGILLGFSLVKKDGTRLSIPSNREFSYRYSNGGSFVSSKRVGLVLLERNVHLNQEAGCLIGIPFSEFGVEGPEAFRTLEISVFSPNMQAGAEFWIGEISINREGAGIWPLRPPSKTPVIPQEPSEIAEPSRAAPQETERATSSKTPVKEKSNSKATSARKQTAQENSGSSAAKPEQGVAGATAERPAGYTAPAPDAVVWNDSSNPWLPALLAFGGLCIFVFAAAFQYNRIYRKKQKEGCAEEPPATEEPQNETVKQTEKQEVEQEHRDV